MKMEIEGKSAIVTGAGQGIGKSIALTLSEAGARVVVVDINEEAAKAVCQNIKAKGGKAYSIKADVSVKKQVEIMIESSVEKLGGLDILVNSAGINKFVPILDLKEEDWDAIIAVNTKGVFLCSQAAARLMVAQKNGRIVNISSNCSRIARMFMGAYCPSKAAVTSFTQVLALELAKYGVLVNAVFPGATATEMQKKTQKETGLGEKVIYGDLETFRTGIPLGKMADPEDIAAAVLFLVSDASKHITGQAICVDGGQTMF
jgi:2,3-dihydro-2,3-dihydroxybenzoate dehydrogenase